MHSLYLELLEGRLILAILEDLGILDHLDLLERLGILDHLERLWILVDPEILAHHLTLGYLVIL